MSAKFHLIYALELHSTHHRPHKRLQAAVASNTEGRASSQPAPVPPALEPAPSFTWRVDESHVVPILQVSSLHEHHGDLLGTFMQLHTR